MYQLASNEKERGQRSRRKEGGGGGGVGEVIGRKGAGWEERKEGRREEGGRGGARAGWEKERIERGEVCREGFL